jgi:LmbE family N-acetylglucosaminyl deacetylase
VVTVVVATDGDASPAGGLERAEVARRRRAEAAQACAVLGVSEVRHLALADGALGRPDVAVELRRRLREIIADARPEAVFTPWFGDGHPDHRATSEAVATVVAAHDAGPAVWAYETWTPLAPNRLVDISAAFARKQTAVEAHATARLAFDLGALLALNRYRSAHGLAGNGHAEAFLALSADEYAALASRMEDSRPGAGSG